MVGQKHKKKMLKITQRQLNKRSLRILGTSHTRAFAGGAPPGYQVTDTDMFRQVYHNTDTLDHYYEETRKPRQRIDPTKRATQYIVLGASRMIFVTFGRVAVMRAVQYLWAAADVLALSSAEVDLSKIPVGATYVAKWRGSPIFVTHRTLTDIEEARRDDHADLRDPATDAERCEDPQWHIAKAVCTHFGCVPVAGQGGWGGYFCPCHGSHYDKAGRVRKGPAPLNLPLPPYKFISSELLMIG